MPKRSAQVKNRKRTLIVRNPCAIAGEHVPPPGALTAMASETLSVPSRAILTAAGARPAASELSGELSIPDEPGSAAAASKRSALRGTRRVVPGHPAQYDKAASRDGFERTRAFLDEFVRDAKR
jgi:hypothetical protein